MARRKPTSEDESSPSFEDALAELEVVVESMETGELPLEQLVSHYEKGSALLKHCESVLQSAKERLELITLRNQQENALDSAATNLHASPTPPKTPETADESDDDDDIRLF